MRLSCRQTITTIGKAMAGSVEGWPRLLLRAEGLAALAVSALLFWRTGGMATLGVGWPLLIVLFLAPDLSFAAYLAGPRIGAICYNALHSYVGPLALAAFAFFNASTPLQALALLWTAHIGFDRALGYGLKYESAFGDTHLGRIGKAK